MTLSMKEIRAEVLESGGKTPLLRVKELGERFPESIALRNKEFGIWNEISYLEFWSRKTLSYSWFGVLGPSHRNYSSITSAALFGNSLLTAADAAAVGFIWQGNVWLVTKLGTVLLQAQFHFRGSFWKRLHISFREQLGFVPAHNFNSTH